MKTKSKQNLKKLKNTSLKEKGITLIALVITIVVLIILAGVAINLTLSQNGIFNKAKEAKELYINAQEDEQKKINEITEQITTGEFSNGSNNLPENDGNNTLPGNTENTKPGGKEELTEETKDLKAGDYIKYDTGVTSVGENGVIICRVLYDSTSEYGLQIISEKSVTNEVLGGSNWTTGRDDYNNVITILNAKAEKYLNTKYATDSRCVGSIPILQNGKFINKNSENEGPVTLQLTSSAEGISNMKDTDTNYENDKTQMESLNIWKTGENYWIASRCVNSDSSDCVFSVRIVNTTGNLNIGVLCSVNYKYGAMGSSGERGIRPCFSLKSDIKITGGNGTSNEPYIM